MHIYHHEPPHHQPPHHHHVELVEPFPQFHQLPQSADIVHVFTISLAAMYTTPHEDHQPPHAQEETHAHQPHQDAHQPQLHQVFIVAHVVTH